MSAIFPIEDDERWRSHTATAGQVTFPVTYPFQDNKDIYVERINLDGTITPLHEPADYVLIGAGDPAGGSYTLTVPALAGQKFRSIGDALMERTQSIVRSGRYASAATDSDLDRALIRDQELRREAGRAMKVDLGKSGGRVDQLAADEFWMSDGKGNMVLGGSAAGIRDASSSAIIAVEARIATEAARDVTLSAVPSAFPPSVTALKNLPVFPGTNARLTAAGRFGDFVQVNYADHAALIDLDTQNGLFARSTTDPTKAWMRARTGPLNAHWFGCLPDLDAATTLATATAAWQVNLALSGPGIYFPEGRRSTGSASWPWRQIDPSGGLLDCHDTIISGDGPTTIFATDADLNGADVFQLNGVKNLHFRKLAITGTRTGPTNSGHGSSGISVTGGWDNITIDDVDIYRLPGVDKGSGVDGGKALTMQSEGSTNPCGSLKASIRAEFCAEGFGFENNLTQTQTKDTSIDVEVTAKRCYMAVKILAGAATGAVPAGPLTGVNVKAFAVDCQHGLIANRMHGGSVDLTNIATVVASTKRTNAEGNFYVVTDSTVDVGYILYAKNARINLNGNAGACTNKVTIGGTTGGTIAGRTEQCDIAIDMRGSPSSGVDVLGVDAGGNSMHDCLFTISPATSTLANLPALMRDPANGNTVIYGGNLRAARAALIGRTSFFNTAAGTQETAAIDVFDTSVIGLQGKFTGTAGAVVAGLYDNSGTFRLGIVNGNGIVVDALGTTSAVGAYVGKHPIYSKSTGALIGYIPIYS